MESKAPSWRASGARSAPLGHTTVRVSGSTVAWAKNSTWRSGSKTGPTGPPSFASRSTVRTVPSAKLTFSRYPPRCSTERTS